MNTNTDTHACTCCPLVAQVETMTDGALLGVAMGDLTPYNDRELNYLSDELRGRGFGDGAARTRVEAAYKLVTALA